MSEPAPSTLLALVSVFTAVPEMKEEITMSSCENMRLLWRYVWNNWLLFLVWLRKNSKLQEHSVSLNLRLQQLQKQWQSFNYDKVLKFDLLHMYVSTFTVLTTYKHTPAVRWTAVDTWLHCIQSWKNANSYFTNISNIFLISGKFTNVRETAQNRNQPNKLKMHSTHCPPLVAFLDEG